MSRVVRELLGIDSLKARLELELNEPEPSSSFISSSFIKRARAQASMLKLASLNEPTYIYIYIIFNILI